jgi:hypothetical protein
MTFVSLDSIHQARACYGTACFFIAAMSNPSVHYILFLQVIAINFVVVVVVVRSSSHEVVILFKTNVCVYHHDSLK